MIDKFVGSLMIDNLIFGDLNSLSLIYNLSKFILETTLLFYYFINLNIFI